MLVLVCCALVCKKNLGAFNMRPSSSKHIPKHIGSSCSLLSDIDTTMYEFKFET
jgi:hypothetical protein